MQENKREVRKRLLKERNTLGKSCGEASSALVCKHILACELYQEAQAILGYLAFGPELSIDMVLKQALAEGKRVYVPKIVSPTEFVAVALKDMQNFELDRYGIRSVPEPAEVLEPEQLDLILVPGVAFAFNGGRMGMGAGYYDRFLPKATRAKCLGVAYEKMLQEQLPLDEHDVPIEQLVTEAGIVKTNR